MPIILTPYDSLRLVTSSNATIDVDASWVDLVLATGAATPGNTGTAISSAATTPIVAAPNAGTIRKILDLSIRNKHASLASTVRLERYNGSVAYERDTRSLGPGSSISVGESGIVLPLPTGGQPTPTWHGHILGAYGNCIPGDVMAMVQGAGTVAATPTNITASIARCAMFRPPCDITVNRIRFYGVGATTNIYTAAIYRYSDLARLTASLTFSTAANAWGVAGTALNVALSKDALYFIACSVNTTGTTPGIACMGPSVAATTGQIQSTPAALPGGMSADSGYLDGYQFQFAVTTGAMPVTAPTLAMQAAWTGGMPAFWLDNADT